MTTPNTETTANQSFQYINNGIQSIGFISLSHDEFEKISNVYHTLNEACGVASFLKNIFQLEDKKLIVYDNPFWMGHGNDTGIRRILGSLQCDIDFIRDSLSETNIELLEIEKIRDDLALVFDQVNLISSWIYLKDINKDAASLRLIASYSSIFQNIHSITNQLFSECALLYKATKRRTETEMLGGAA